MTVQPKPERFWNRKDQDEEMQMQIIVVSEGTEALAVRLARAYGNPAVVMTAGETFGDFPRATKVKLAITDADEARESLTQLREARAAAHEGGSVWVVTDPAGASAFRSLADNGGAGSYALNPFIVMVFDETGSAAELKRTIPV